MDINALITRAIEARNAAYAPYSGFWVGAALLARSGRVYTGVNIENAAYSPTLCAERTAFAKAVSEGEREFAAIAICGWPGDGAPGLAYPCGVCRQVMSEFCAPAEFAVIVAASAEDYREHTLAELLPHGFEIPRQARNDGASGVFQRLQESSYNTTGGCIE